MNKKNINSFWTYLFTVLLCVTVLLLAWRYTSTFTMNDAGVKLDPIIATVTEVGESKTTTDIFSGGTAYYTTIQSFSCLLESGDNKGETITATQILDGVVPTGMKVVEVGDKCLVLLGLDPTKPDEYSFSDYWRFPYAIGLLILFFIGILIFGRVKGASTIISLILTCASIFAVFIPAVLAGQDIYYWAVACCIYVIFMTLLVVNGWSVKTLTAVLGCLGGVALAGFITVTLSKMMNLTGLLDSESMFLQNLSHPINLKGVIFASIIIGAMGAVMDVSMSVSSALYELCDQVEKPTFSILMKSGVNIGQDMMGTMANTLILAYIGSSLSTVLLLTAYQPTFIDIMNREIIMAEILQALVGSIGILFALPFTSFISSVLYPKAKSKKMKAEIDKENMDKAEKIALEVKPLINNDENEK